MLNFKVIATLSLVGLTACAPRGVPQLTPDGQPLPVSHAIDARESEVIPQRVLQQINTLRGNVGSSQLMLNPQLSAAAMAHSRDMSAQNRAWHWGSDGSSPLDRARRQGYMGHIIGENISETYENDIQTLNAWMTMRDTRDIIMDPAATSLGLAWYQEPSGKLWWTLLTGS
ncbi:CAP domain-containing protein [Paracoccus caeni]|uniref:CAP domain-containing protein n=1 Tax=Paracoccus caeni TaxID=657651 RepID=A0A934VVG6_9RHOB|nr:CAP domain-containing protein [Paracoccus caeni]MBK4216931.1 CAP domain-containing protein [Paracoccus caeni]